MVTRSQPLVSAAPRPVVVTAGMIERFSGKRPPHESYRLEPVEDQGAQYQLALDFDADHDPDHDPDAGGGEPINPFYGIPFGVAMLLARDDEGAPAGFITFRRDLRESRRPGDGGSQALYDFKVFVFMVRADLRGQGVGSALAIGCLMAMRDDLGALWRECREGERPEVSMRFVGEGKSDGGLALLDRVASKLGILAKVVFRDCGLALSTVATDIS
jgi:GNAT superfamily N-acetyltransferase